MWVCWLDGKPAVRLDEADVVLAAMREYIKDAEAVTTPAKDLLPSATQSSDDDRKVSVTNDRPKDREPRLTRERMEERQPIAIAGIIRTANHRSDVILRDLSQQGCRFVAKNSSLPRGALLTIRIGSIGPIDAEVMWSQEEITGIRFREPLHSSVFAHICQSSSFTGVD